MLRAKLFRIRRDTIIRGAFFLTIGQACLAISGYVVNVLLARILEVEDYGIYGLIMSLLVWIELVLAPGIGLALEKSIAAQAGKAKTLWHQALWLQGAITIVIFCLTIALAPFIAGLLKDQRLSFLIRFAAIDLLCFGFYRLGRGLETGLQQFGRVSLILGTYAVIKATAIPLLALSSLRLVGAFAGNTLATVGAVILIVYFARGLTEQAPIDSPGDKLKNNFLTAVPLSIAVFTSMILISLDIWVIKSLGTADKILGLYVAASMIPKALLLLSGARVGMMISVIARAKAARDYRATRRSFLKIITLFGAIIGLFTLFVLLFAEVLIRTIFSNSYIAAVPYLQILTFSYAAFAIAETFSWTLIALNQAKKLALIWSGVSLLAFPTYIVMGRLWGPIGIAASVGILSVAISALLLWMIRTALADLRRVSDNQNEPITATP